MERFTVRLTAAHKPAGGKPLVFKNPVLTASGTFGYGMEFAPYGDLTHLGGIVVKGLSPAAPARQPAAPRGGNALRDAQCRGLAKRRRGILPQEQAPPACRGTKRRSSPTFTPHRRTSSASLPPSSPPRKGLPGLEVNISCPT